MGISPTGNRTDWAVLTAVSGWHQGRGWTQPWDKQRALLEGDALPSLIFVPLTNPLTSWNMLILVYTTISRCVLLSLCGMAFLIRHPHFPSTYNTHPNSSLKLYIYVPCLAIPWLILLEILLLWPEYVSTAMYILKNQNCFFRYWLSLIHHDARETAVHSSTESNSPGPNTELVHSHWLEECKTELMACCLNPHLLVMDTSSGLQRTSCPRPRLSYEAFIQALSTT